MPAINVNLADVWLTLPAVVLFLVSCIPITLKVLNGNRDLPEGVVFGIAAIGLIVSAALVLKQWDHVSASRFQNALVFDGISGWTNLITILVTLGTLVFSMKNKGTSGVQFSEHVFLILNAAVGMMVLVWSNDLIVTFIGMELMSLSIYLCIGMSHEQKLSKEAAFKYFILGSLASAIFLFGMAFVYGNAGTTKLSTLLTVAPGLVVSNKLFLIGLILMLSGLSFKISLFPFHSWTPDVYQGAPTPITAFMATGVKAAMFMVVLRLFATQVFSGMDAVLEALQWVAVLTVFIGNLAAIRQTNLKRMLAYSSIAHSGYALIGLIALGYGAGSAQSATSIVFYLLIYSIMNIGAFGLVSLLEKDEDSEILVDDLKGLAASRPGVAFALALLMLSLAGIPPTAGFFSKFYVFSVAIEANLIWLAVWGVLGSVVSVYYYLKPVVNMYMMTEDRSFSFIQRNRIGFSTVGICAVAVVILGLSVSPIYTLMKHSISRMFQF
ncbi:MAG: NADH-quinone oxidoreductase subunit N [Bdellovibrionales bacterium]|nr:NADH-quinone oxidoreductase subunit N [Bdellovibrionales bacterium]